MTKVPSDTSNWCSLPRNISLWLAGCKSPTSVPGLQALAESYSVGHSLEEMNTETQELAAENALLKAKLGKGVSKREIQSLLNAHSENQQLKKTLADQKTPKACSDSDPAQFSYKIVQQQALELKKLVDLPDSIAGDPENTQKNLKLLGVLNHYWGNYTAVLKTYMKNSLRSSQFSLFCLLASSKVEKELVKEAKEVLSEIDNTIITDAYNLQTVFNCLDRLENLKLSLMQKNKLNKQLVDLKEPILKQRNLIQSCVNFLKDKKVEVPHKVASDWSAKSLLQGFQIQEKLMQSVFEVSKPVTLQVQQEKDLKLLHLERENELLLALQEGKKVSMMDRSFQENLEVIKQLTDQNKELLSLLFEKRSNSVPKTLQKIHSETQELDNELESIQEEIKTGQLTSHSPKHSFSVEKLANENFLLKKDLVEKEAKFVIYKHNNRGAKFEEKLKEKDRVIKNLLQEKKDMNECIEKLRWNVHSLDVKARNHKNIKEQYRTLNLIQSERENVIVNMKQQMEKQKLKSQAAFNQTNKKKYGLLKSVNCLTEIVKSHEPSFEGLRGIEEIRIEAEQEMNAYTHKVQGQIAKLTEKCCNLEEELARTQEIVKNQQDDIEERIQTMLDIADLIDLRNSKIKLEKETNEHINTAGDLETQIHQLQDEIKLFLQNAGEISQDTQANDEKIQEFEQCFFTFNAKRAVIEEMLAKMQASSQPLKDNIEELNQKIKMNHQKDEVAIQAIDSIRNQYEEKLSSLGLFVSDSDENATSIQNYLTQTSATIDKFKTENENLKISIENSKKDNKNNQETKKNKKNKELCSEETNLNNEESSKKKDKKNELSRKKSSRKKADDIAHTEREGKIESKKSLKKKESSRKKKKEVLEENTSGLDQLTDEGVAKEERKKDNSKSKSARKESSKTKEDSPINSKRKTGNKDNSKDESPKKETSKKKSLRTQENEILTNEIQQNSNKKEKKNKNNVEEPKKSKKSDEGKEKSSKSKKSKA